MQKDYINKQGNVFSTRMFANGVKIVKIQPDKMTFVDEFEAQKQLDWRAKLYGWKEVSLENY